MPQGEQVKNGKAFEYYFDDRNHLVWYQGIGYPYREIKEEQQSDVIWHIVSTTDLERVLYNSEEGYASNVAQTLDEQITYYVGSLKDLHTPAEQILKEIYG